MCVNYVYGVCVYMCVCIHRRERKRERERCLLSPQLLQTPTVPITV